MTSAGESSTSGHAPTVSVLMPTYQQASFLPRALLSLLRQEFTEWELVVVNDGSRDHTDELIAQYDDPRIKVITLPRNQGLGAALNIATAAARGRYIAYLPSDDKMDLDHLSTAVSILEETPDVYLAYAGVRWRKAPPGKVIRRFTTSSALRDDFLPFEEEKLLSTPTPQDAPMHSGNPLALVQVVHRRDLEDSVRWIERTEKVSDTLELDFWTSLLRAGAKFHFTGRTSCEWSDHPDQHHKIVAGRGSHPADPLEMDNGLSYYRQFYRVDGSQLLNWQPVASGMPLDERKRYGLLRTPPTRRDGLRILLVGALGFNQERVLAFEEKGHQLAGLWLGKPPYFESTGPFPFGNIHDIFVDEDWRGAVKKYNPDVIYGLLNFHALPLIKDVLRSDLGAPVAFHFKESPTMAMQMGHWATLRELLTESDGRILISPENREWLELACGRRFPDDSTLILDGDPPKQDWMTDDWSPKLSDDDNEPHTVCVGRVFLEPLADLTASRIHVHVYGSPFIRWANEWMKEHVDSRYLHLHPAVEPSDWVSELSKYDAGWCHVHTSQNQGDINRAEWNDLNIPARLGTYATAGLPLLFRDNSEHSVTIERIANEHGVGIPYINAEDLSSRLHEERSHRRAHHNMVKNRKVFSFDYHVPRLIGFFEELISRF